MNYKLIAVLILIIIYLYQQFLHLLQLRSASNPLPKNVSDIYDADTFRTWCAYLKENVRLSFFSLTASSLLFLLLIGFDAYAAFAAFFPGAPFWQIFAVLLLQSLTDLLMTPFSYYDTMVIEQKYGFNRSTKKTFWLDQMKEFVISFILIVGLALLLRWLHRGLGDWMILAFAIVMVLFGLFLTFFYPFFSQIFNKFTPLEGGELKEKVTALLEKHGYQVRAIQVMDASRRSTKSNAYFTGFGKMKTIVLYDTLLETMTTDEICAVFAHEMGHGLHKDMLRNQFLSFLSMAVLGLLAWLTVRKPAVFSAFGFSEVNYGFAVLLILSVEFPLISPLLSLITNYFSRRAEYSADRQAVLEGYGEAQISALKKLTKENFGDIAPSPLLVKLKYSHPTLSQRIEFIEKEREKAKNKKPPQGEVSSRA